MMTRACLLLKPVAEIVSTVTEDGRHRGRKDETTHLSLLLQGVDQRIVGQENRTMVLRSMRSAAATE
jgi:hypothetical protein